MRLRDTIFSILLGSAILIALALGVGESPAVYWRAFYSGLIENQTGVWGTLGYATLLLCTALAIRIPLTAGYFNIGAEGQMILGGIGAYSISGFLPPGPLSLFLSVLAAATFGALWSGLVAFLKTSRGVHEVVGGIFLNYVAYALLGYLLSGPFKDPGGWSPESKVVPFRLPMYPDEASNAPSIIFVAVVLILPAFSKLISTSAFGLTLRALRKNPEAVTYAGLKGAKTLIIAGAVAGGFAGLAGAHDVLGPGGRLREGFSSGFGFMGIGVALLAGTSYWGLPLAAIFMGALFQVATELQIESDKLSSGAMGILQASIIIIVAIFMARARQSDKSKGQKHA